jgi:YHS domain-containing protein
MRRLFFCGSMLVVLMLGACNHNSKQQSETSVNSPTPSGITVAVKLAELTTNKDLVCGMPLEEGAIADTILHEEKIYGFCAAECKAEFAKNPTAYLAEPK